MAPKPTAKFAANDRVLCYHGAMLYEAKVLDVSTDDRETKYLVHYQGWNNRWDEWVLDDRLLEPTDENLKKQQELEGKHGSTAGGKGGGGRKGGASQGAPSTATPKSKVPGTGG